MNVSAEPARPGTLTARGLAPIVALYLVAALVYAVISRRIEVPIIFPDEFTYGHIAQSIANGDGVSWRGEPWSLRSLLYVLAIAPSWIVSSGHSAYEVARVLNAVMATFVVVPVWLTARALAGPRLAIVPAILAAAGTWMLTTGYLLSESLALPLAVGSLAAMIAALRTPGSRWWIWSLLLAGLASYARLQLVALVPVLLLALVVDCARVEPAARGARVRAHRWPLAISAGASLVGLLVALASPDSLGVYESVRHFSPGLGKVLGASGQHGLAVIVIAGFLPAVLTLALAVRRGNWRDDTTGPFLAVLLSATLVLVLQSGWFGAGFHLKWDIERYVEYLIPLSFVALVLAPGRVRLRDGLLVTAGLSLLLLLVDAPQNVVEQRGVRGSVQRLGELIPTFADHPGLGLAVAGALVGCGGLLLLLRPPARLSASGAVVATAGLVLVILLIQSQASWHTEHQISERRRAAQPADLDWVDHRAKGPVGILNTSLDNPNLYATELFNEKIRGRYHVRSGLGAIGPLCLVSVGPAGALRGPEGCEPPRHLLLESSFVRATFDGERRLQNNLPNSRLVDVGANPRVLSFVTLPCVEKGSAFRGSTLDVRPCTGRLDLELWPNRPGTLIIRFGPGTAQHYGRLNSATGTQTTYDFKPGVGQTIRIPMSADPAQLSLQLDWSSTAGAPPLERVQLERDGQITNLL